MPVTPRHLPRDAWSRGWGRALVPGLRIHQPERTRYRGSTLCRARRLSLHAAAAAAARSAGLNRCRTTCESQFPLVNSTLSTIRDEMTPKSDSTARPFYSALPHPCGIEVHKGRLQGEHPQLISWRTS